MTVRKEHERRAFSLGGGSLTKQAEGPKQTSIRHALYAEGRYQTGRILYPPGHTCRMPIKENEAAATCNLFDHDEQTRIRAAKEYFKKAKGFLNPLHHRSLTR